MNECMMNVASDLISFGTIQLLRCENRAYGNMMLWWHFDNCSCKIKKYIFNCY